MVAFSKYLCFGLFVLLCGFGFAAEPVKSNVAEIDETVLSRLENLEFQVTGVLEAYQNLLARVSKLEQPKPTAAKVGYAQSVGSSDGYSSLGSQVVSTYSPPIATYEASTPTVVREVARTRSVTPTVVRTGVFGLRRATVSQPRMYCDANGCYMQ